MKIYIITLKYLKPLDVIDQYLQEHRAHLDQFYQTKEFMASGPQDPRVGGVILAHVSSEDRIHAIMAQDPFCKYQLVDYTVTAFEAVKIQPELADFIKNK